MESQLAGFAKFPGQADLVYQFLAVSAAVALKSWFVVWDLLGVPAGLVVY
jgi:hypothetical protein